MKSKRQAISVLVAIFFFATLSTVSLEDIERDDFIKDHSVDIAKIIQKFDFIASRQIPPTKIAAANNIPPPLDVSPFGPPVICIVSYSKEELTEIWNVIETDESAEIGSPLNFTYSTSCNELEKIKSEIFKLKYDFKQLLKQQTSSTKYEELKASYEKEMQWLVKRLDGEKQNADSEQMIIVGQLSDELQLQQDKINQLLKQLEKEQIGLNEAYVRLCVSKINSNHIDEAVDVFKNNINHSEMKRIVLGSYSTNNENFEKIVLFIRGVADPTPSLIGYTCLFDKLTEQNLLRGMNIFILANELRTNTDRRFKELRTAVMDILHAMIRKNDLQLFIKYANTKGDSRDMNFVKEVMPMIVRLIYDKPTPMLYGDDSRNVVFLLKLSRKLSNLHHRLYIINDLLTVMRDVGHTTKNSLFPIVYSVIQARRESKKDDDDEYVKDLVVKVENSLPDGVRVFMSSDLCIRNLKDGGFMTFGSNDSSTGMVWTLNTTTFDTFENEFTLIDNGKAMRIRNVEYDKYLYVYDKEGRAVSSFSAFPFQLLGGILSAILGSDFGADFIIGIVDEGKFTIKNKHYDEYLFSTQNSPFGTVVETILGSSGVSGLHQVSCRSHEGGRPEDDLIWIIKQCSSFK